MIGRYSHFKVDARKNPANKVGFSISKARATRKKAV
jgi:hypothetical protein